MNARASTRALALLSVLVAGGLAAPLAGAQVPLEACTPSPLGWVCRFDGDGDGTPERVYLYSDARPQLLVLDVWRQSGTDTVKAGGGTALTPWSPTWTRTTLVQRDANGDGDAESWTVTVDSWLPSDIGGWVQVKVYDGSGDGRADRAGVFLFHSHHGSVSHDSGRLLP